MEKLKSGDKVWVKVPNEKGKMIICKREFCRYQEDGSLIIRSYDSEYVSRHEVNDYGITWAINKGELEK